MKSEKPFLTDIQILRGRARQRIGEGATRLGDSAHRETVTALLNDLLATEAVCVQRYRRYQFLATSIDAQGIADQFAAHSNEEQAHADRIAACIVELGGQVDHSRVGLVSSAHVEDATGKSFTDLLKEDMIAECIAMDIFRDIIGYLDDRDPVTRRMLEAILAVQELRADELANLLESTPEQLQEKH